MIWYGWGTLLKVDIAQWETHNLNIPWPKTVIHVSFVTTVITLGIGLMLSSLCLSFTATFSGSYSNTMSLGLWVPSSGMPLQIGIIGVICGGSTGRSMLATIHLRNGGTCHVPSSRYTHAFLPTCMHYSELHACIATACSVCHRLCCFAVINLTLGFCQRHGAIAFSHVQV